MEPGAGITIKDVADLLFAARERIDFYWNFYVVVVVAVVGWLVSLKKTLTVSMKVLVSYTSPPGTILLPLATRGRFLDSPNSWSSYPAGRLVCPVLRA